MSEKKRERTKNSVDNPTDPKTRETKQGKQTKFVLDVGDMVATPEQIEAIKSSILKNAMVELKKINVAGVKGDAIRPKIGAEFFSLSFSMSFSLGA
ncbi:hypothetical protein BH10BAC5_BH10BAC5_20100 [soil metagenome]